MRSSFDEKLMAVTTIIVGICTLALVGSILGSLLLSHL